MHLITGHYTTKLYKTTFSRRRKKYTTITGPLTGKYSKAQNANLNGKWWLWKGAGAMSQHIHKLAYLYENVKWTY